MLDLKSIFNCKIIINLGVCGMTQGEFWNNGKKISEFRRK